MGQLKGNLMPAHGQWVQHPRVIIAVFITSMWVGTCCDFSCVEQSLPVTCASVLKIPSQGVHYQVYYT